MQKTGQCVLFAFISYENKSAGKTLNVLHSLLFQALEEVPSLQPILPDSSNADHKKLARDQSFVMGLFHTVLTSIGPAFIVLDGLDEIEEVAWKDLLSTIADIQKNCAETKVLISSREVRGITLTLEKHAVIFRVDKNNLEDIRAFVRAESHDLILEVESCGASKQVCTEIRAAMEFIAEKSEGIHPFPTVSLGSLLTLFGGMFLYAKLVLHMV
jgi:hypothetical protein